MRLPCYLCDLLSWEDVSSEQRPMTRRPFLLLTGLALCAGCDGGKTPVDFRHTPGQKGTSVATFAKDSISREELEQRFAEMNPYARARYQTVEQRREYVEGLLRFELLAQEALARGMQNDPDVVETAKKVMVQRLIQKELESRGGTPTDAELADYYQKHKADYVRPEQLRLSHVFLAAPKADAALRERKQKEALAVLASAKALDPMDFGAFGKLAREKSEEPRTKPLDGDMRFLNAEELKNAYGPEVLAAAQGLTQVGQLSDVVATDGGFHVLKLQGKQAALNLPLENVKPQIQSRLQYERRMEAHARFLEELKQKYGARIDDKALAEVKVDLQAPQKAPQQQGVPGFVGPTSSTPPSLTVPPPTPAPNPGGSRAAAQ